MLAAATVASTALTAAPVDLTMHATYDSLAQRAIKLREARTADAATCTTVSEQATL